MNVKKGPSWAAVVIMLILFWPVGLYLLVKKLNSDRSAVMHKQGGIKTLGIVLMAIGILAVIGGTTGGVYFIIGGGIALWQANKAAKKGARYRMYIDLVVNKGISSIDAISQSTGIPYNECVSDLNAMIGQNYFPGAYVNTGARMLAARENHAVPPQFVPPPVVQPVMAGQPAPAAPAGPRTVQCKGCGANNMVVAAVGQCEYCGSVL